MCVCATGWAGVAHRAVRGDRGALEADAQLQQPEPPFDRLRAHAAPTSAWQAARAFAYLCSGDRGLGRVAVRRSVPVVEMCIEALAGHCKIGITGVQAFRLGEPVLRGDCRIQRGDVEVVGAIVKESPTRWDS